MGLPGVRARGGGGRGADRLDRRRTPGTNLPSILRTPHTNLHSILRIPRTNLPSVLGFLGPSYLGLGFRV
eukprot:1788835-Rhodomonas_salina.6